MLVPVVNPRPASHLLSDGFLWGKLVNTKCLLLLNNTARPGCGPCSEHRTPHLSNQEPQSRTVSHLLPRRTVKDVIKLSLFCIHRKQDSIKRGQKLQHDPRVTQEEHAQICLSLSDLPALQGGYTHKGDTTGTGLGPAPWGQRFPHRV